MDTQFLIYMATALFVYAVVPRERRRPREHVIYGVLCGLLASALVINGGVREFGQRASEAPHRLKDDAAVLAQGSELMAKANLSAFAAARFDHFPDERAVVTQLRTLAPGDTHPEVFVLTDDAILYILTGQEKPVFHSDMYNASPVYEQERVVRWLETDRPPFVVFDPNALDFDQFQKAVRLPLVFAAVIDNYVPRGTAGRFQILQHKRLGEPTAIAYWRQELGSTVDFGRLAELSSFRRLSARSAQPVGRCMDFLEVKLNGNIPKDGRAHIPFDVDGMEFDLVLKTDSKTGTYYVLLDRFWPWHAGKCAGVEAKVAAEKLSTEIRTKVIRRNVPEGILY